MQTILSWLALTFVTVSTFAQEPMTAEQFRKIASAPGDAVPLVLPLTVIPLWTNSILSNVMTYASGKVFSEEMSQTAKTVGGKYIVFAAESKYYQQTMNCILTYDEKAAALKTYGLYGETVTEGTVVYDAAKKIYAITSSYSDGFLEVTIGSYSDKESSDRTLAYKHGVLFVTRNVKCRPANPAASQTNSSTSNVVR